MHASVVCSVDCARAEQSFAWLDHFVAAQVRRDFAAAEGAFAAILAEDPNDREVLAAIQAMKQERGA